MPQTQAPARGQIWACQEIHAQSLVNFGWDWGWGSARDIWVELETLFLKPLRLWGRSLGRPLPCHCHGLDPLWPLFCSIEQLPWAWVMSIVFMCLAFPNRLQSDPGLLKTSGWGRQGEG